MSKEKNFKHFGPSFKKEPRNKNKRACIECEKRVEELEILKVKFEFYGRINDI